MSPLDLLAVAGAGLAAGAVNTIAGAGSLLSFPVLVTVGLSPLAANVTNDVGLTPSNAAGAASFRREFPGQGPLLRVVLPVAAASSLVGGALLLEAPPKVFATAAPVMLAVGALLALAQPRLDRLRHGACAKRRWLGVAIGAVAMYGGYFGTGIGVLFVAVLQAFVKDGLRRLNATKTLLALMSNGVAGVLFAFLGPVNWSFALVLAASASIGAPIGGRLSYRISAGVLRAVICVVGLAASGYLFWQRS